MGYFIRLLIITAVGVGVLGVLLLMLKLAVIVAVAVALVIAGVVALAMLAGKRLRSTPQTRPPPLP